MTFLLNTIAFFILLGMGIFILICAVVIDYIRNKLFKRNRRIDKYIKRGKRG